MTLDIATLMAAGSLVAALSALVLGGAWILMRDRALAWWASAAAFLSFAIFMLTMGVLSVDTGKIALGGGIAAFSPALVWAGAREFSRRKVRISILFAGTAAILAAMAVESVDPTHFVVRLTSFAAWIGYLIAAAVELWRGHGEGLRARWPLIFLFALHAAMFAGGMIDSFVGSFSLIGVPLTLRSWFGLIHFESLIYSMGTAVFMIVMCKERSELHYRNAAGFDSLTGVASRGAFMAEAEKLFARSQKGDLPLTVVVFDLDRFKTINDTYGHKIGDHILRTFADSARRVLRPNDLVGRHGGEEFALVLSPATVETGYVIAERIRVGFSEACRQLDTPIAATLSAGVASLSTDPTFDTLLDRADAALYRAKHLGRNRVERADDGDVSRPSNVIRVA